MKEIIILALSIIIPVLIVIIGFLWIHKDDYPSKAIKNLDKYIMDSLIEERDALMIRYKDLKVKKDVVAPEYFDVVYREYKNVEERLEINRARIMAEKKKMAEA